MVRVEAYPLKHQEEQIVELPILARPLAVKMQFGKPCLWALGNPDAPKKNVKIRVLSTGPRDGQADKLEYIGTLLAYDGTLPLHYFIEKED